MADLPHKEHPRFIDAQRMMKRRNRAAALLAIVSVPTGIQVNPPSLTTTALAPTISVTGAETQAQSSRHKLIETPRYQPRKNFASLFKATFSAPVAGSSIAIPTTPLQMQSLAPTIVQATPIFSGQDLQSERDPEVWQPGRRNYLFAYQTPGNTLVSVNNGSLTLTALAPDVLRSGVVSVPSASVTLTALVPTIAQANTGRVDIDLTPLLLTALAPTIDITGPGLITMDAPTVTLTALPVTIQQFADIGRVNITMHSEKIAIRMRRA